MCAGAKYERRKMRLIPFLQDVETKCGIILKIVFCVISPMFGKNAINLNFNE